MHEPLGKKNCIEPCADIKGTWKLISFVQNDDNGNTIYPLGENPVGYLIYYDDGYMSVTIMSSNRINYKSEDFIKAAKSEKITALESYSSYCGKYSIDGDKVIHHIEVCLIPNWVNTSQVRSFRINDGILELKTQPVEYDGKKQVASLKWKRTSGLDFY